LPGPFVPSSVLELTGEFLDAKIAAGLSPRTISTYRQRLAYFTPGSAEREVTRPRARAYLKHLQEQPTLTQEPRGVLP
jgi:hypothetical protein